MKVCVDCFFFIYCFVFSVLLVVPRLVGGVHSVRSYEHRTDPESTSACFIQIGSRQGILSAPDSFLAHGIKKHRERNELSNSGRIPTTDWGALVGRSRRDCPRAARSYDSDCSATLNQRRAFVSS